MGGSKLFDVEVLKTSLLADFNEYIVEDNFQFGFIEPGHGKKGRQNVLKDANDLTKMYDAYKNKKGIVLWLKVTKRKRPLSMHNNQKQAKKLCGE